jgi:hypothetical protein
MSGNDDREPVAPAMDPTDVFSDEEIETLITWCDDHLGSAEVAPILANAIVDNVMPGNTWELYDVQGRVYPPIESDEENALLTRAPNEGYAIERFVGHFAQMGRACIGDPEAIPAAERLLDGTGIKSVEALREELEADVLEQEIRERRAVENAIEDLEAADE